MVKFYSKFPSVNLRKVNVYIVAFGVLQIIGLFGRNYWVGMEPKSLYVVIVGSQILYIMLLTDQFRRMQDAKLELMPT